MAEEDFGAYTCQAENYLGTSQAQVALSGI